MLPERFVQRVLRDLGASEGRALCEALDTPSPVAVRLHPDKTGLSVRTDATVGTETPCCGRDTNSRCFCGAVATLPDLTFDRSVPWSPWGGILPSGLRLRSTPISMPVLITCRSHRRSSLGICCRTYRPRERGFWICALLRAVRRRFTHRWSAPTDWSSLMKSIGGVLPFWRITCGNGVWEIRSLRSANRVRWAIARRFSMSWPWMRLARAKECSARISIRVRSGAKTTCTSALGGRMRFCGRLGGRCVSVER